MESQKRSVEDEAINFAFFEDKAHSVRHRSGKNLSSQHGNAATCLLRSSLFRVDSTFEMLFATNT